MQHGSITEKRSKQSSLITLAQVPLLNGAALPLVKPLKLGGF